MEKEYTEKNGVTLKSKRLSKPEEAGRRRQHCQENEEGRDEAFNWLYLLLRVTAAFKIT